MTWTPANNSQPSRAMHDDGETHRYCNLAVLFDASWNAADVSWICTDDG